MARTASARRTASPKITSRKTTAGGSSLTPEQLAILEQRLLRDRQKALRVAGSVVEQEAHDARARPGGDAVDISNEVTARANATLLASRGEGLLREIDQALEMLRNEPERYGRCQECGMLIPFERLDILPTARYCATHAR
ncbi:MAG TPA: TraR/DksA family transcriptional regulator [Gemmatimonadaceae bacterium]